MLILFDLLGGISSWLAQQAFNSLVQTWLTPQNLIQGGLLIGGLGVVLLLLKKIFNGIGKVLIFLAIILIIAAIALPLLGVNI